MLLSKVIFTKSGKQFIEYTKEGYPTTFFDKAAGALYPNCGESASTLKGKISLSPVPGCRLDSIVPFHNCLIRPEELMQQET